MPKGYTLRFRLRLDDRPLDGRRDVRRRRRPVGVPLPHLLPRRVRHDLRAERRSTRTATSGRISTPNGTSLSGHTGDTLTMHGTFSDPDGDAMSLSASVGTITDDGDGKHWTWTYTAVASDLVYVTVSDGRLKDQVAFALDVNTPPVLHLPGPQTAGLPRRVERSRSARPMPTQATRSRSAASGLPAGLAFVDNGDRTGTVAGTLTAIPGRVRGDVHGERSRQRSRVGHGHDHGHQGRNHADLQRSHGDPERAGT